jgi:Flp pilus assembly protein TadD
VLRALVLAACAALCAVLCLAACGSSKQAKAQQQTSTRVCRATAEVLAKLQADIAAMRAAARTPTQDRLQGNHAINVATDRFLSDVAVAPIGNLKRNRLIDHAMGTLSGACEQCFQALEASRPVVNIRVGEKRC